MSEKGGRGGVIANPKNFIAKFTHTYEFSGKKRNVISKKGRGVKAVWKFSKKHPFLKQRWSLKSFARVLQPGNVFANKEREKPGNSSEAFAEEDGSESECGEIH